LAMHDVLLWIIHNSCMHHYGIAEMRLCVMH
jgi:hypothetical protein